MASARSGNGEPIGEAQPATSGRGRLRAAAPLVVAAGLVTLLGAISVYLALLRHISLHTDLFDTAYYTQVVWNTAQGRPFATSLKYTNFLGDHFAPLMAALAPFFWFFPGALVLQAAAALAVTSAVVPAYAILRRSLPQAGLLLLLATCFYPLLHQVAVEDFHEITLAAPAVAVAIYALHAERYRLLGAALFVALMAREDMAAYVGSFGLYLALLRPSRRLLGVALMGGAVAWFWLTTTVLVPAFGDGTYLYTGRFGALANGALAFAAQVVKDPVAALAQPSTLRLGESLARVLVPLAALPLLSGGYTLLWLPALALLLAAPEAESFGKYYVWRLAPLLPLRFGTAALGLRRLSSRRATAAAAVALALSLASFVLWSPFPGGGQFSEAKYVVDDRTLAGQRLVERIRPDLAVAVPNFVGAQLGEREWLSLYPWLNSRRAPDIVVVDTTGYDAYPFSRQELEAATRDLRLDLGVKAIWEQDGYLVFSFAENTGFGHNYGVPLAYYARAVEAAARLQARPGESAVYLRLHDDLAGAQLARLQPLAEAKGLALRASTVPEMAVLVGDRAEHFFVLEADDEVAAKRLGALGAARLPGEDIVLPGGAKALHLYRLQGRAREQLQATMSGPAPDLRLANGLRLWRWQAPADLRGQFDLPLFAAWEVLSPPDTASADSDYCLSLHLVDEDGKDLGVADARFERARYLSQGDLVLSWNALPLPAALDLQQAALRVGMFTCWQRRVAPALDSAGKQVADGLSLGPFKVGAAPLPSAGTPLDLRLGSDVSLRGYEVVAPAPRTAVLRLRWRAERRPQGAYTVFVQVVGPGGVVAQQDNPPRRGRYPTSVWDAGEEVPDEYTLVFPPAVPAGEYRLIAGMYTPADVRRLPVSDPAGRALGDAVEFGTLRLGASGEVWFRPR